MKSTRNFISRNYIPLARERSFYRRFFSVWIVLVFYNVITLGVNLIDNVMLGAYDEVAMSGASAVNQLQFLFQQLLLGSSDAVVVLGSQYWGEHRTEPIKKFAVGALLLGALMALVLFLIATVAPEAVLALFTKSPAIRAAGVEYLRVMKYSYLLFAMTTLLLATLRSVETVRIGFFVSLSTLVVNVSLNYLLIEGRFGAPALGVTGAAIATLTARAVELCVVLIYLAFMDKKLVWRLRDFQHVDLGLIRDYLRLVAPFLMTSFIFGSAVAMQTVILGHLSDTAIAANSVASTFYQLVKVAIVGASSAAAILIGKAIGSGEINRVKSYAKTLQLLFVSIGIVTSSLLVLLRGPIVGLYKEITPESREMAQQFILVLSVTGFGTAYQMPTITGIIRGGGDAKFVFYNDLIHIWGLVIPLSLAAAFLLGWPPVAVLFCLNLDQLLKCIPAAIKANRYRWMKKLTR